MNRVWEHKTHALEGFTDNYDVTRLVYFEEYRLAPNAIAREKQVKRWRREKKEKLIAAKNPSWVDLAADWFTPQEIAEEIRKNQNKRSLDSAAKAASLGMTPSKVESKSLSSHDESQNQNKRSLDSAAKAAPLGMTPSNVGSTRSSSQSENQNQNKRSLDSAAKAAPLGMTPSEVGLKATNLVHATRGKR